MGDRLHASAPVSHFIAPAVLFLLLACGGGPTQTEPDGPEPLASGPAITIGDIDPLEPAKRIRRLQPLSDLLGSRLAEHGIERGRVVIARNIQEMAALMTEGEVDLFFDSPFPVLSVRRRAGGEVHLQRAAGGDFEYWSHFITLRGSPIQRLDDLNGRVLALQEPHSTAGYQLPLWTLRQAGYSTEPVEGPRDEMAADRIGYFFTNDEENTVDLIRSGVAAAGVISNQELASLPGEFRQEIREFGRTSSVPRQLVLARRDLAPDLLSTIDSILLGLSEEDRESMAAADPQFGWTWIFDHIDDGSLETLGQIEQQLGGPEGS